MFKLRPRAILLAAMLIVGGVVSYFLLTGVPYYERGDSDHFRIRKGEQFSVSFHANGSTGHTNCWLNDTRCDNVNLTGKDFKTSWREHFGLIGVGGTETFEFTGVKAGSGYD